MRTEPRERTGCDLALWALVHVASGEVAVVCAAGGLGDALQMAEVMGELWGARLAPRPLLSFGGVAGRDRRVEA